MKTHSGEKSNKCNQCDYTFFQAGHLRGHLKTQSGEKLHKCNQCDYASSHAGTLNRHQCNYDAFTANNLREHLKTHSGEKQNKCNHCEYTSSQVSSLRRLLKLMQDYVLSLSFLVRSSLFITLITNRAVWGQLKTAKS